MNMTATTRAVVCLSLCLAFCQVRGSHIPGQMNRTIKSLLDHYGLSKKVIISGKPVFSREPLTGKLEAQRLFMEGVLETYETIFGHMLKELPTPSPLTTGSNSGATGRPDSGTGTSVRDGDVRENLTYLLKRVKALRKGLRHHEEVKLLQSLHALKSVKMDNPVVQSKALWELNWLYQEASSLSVKSLNKTRRRRQARRLKTHLKP